jgi:putative membrane protein insertion efficiency factor
LAGLATAAGFVAGLATGFAAGLATGGLATGLATFFATGFGTGLAALCATTGLAAGFFTADLAALALAGFFATGLAAFFAAGLLAGAAFLAGAFFTTGFFATGFFAAGLAAFFATGFPAAAFFTGAFTLAFAVRAPAAFALAAALPGRAGAFPLPALAVVELRVVFAIFLHHFWPWRPGVIAHVSYTGKPASGILATLPATSCSGNVNALTRFLLFLLRLYKRWLSPLLGQRCRFYPSCSDYARVAVTRFGPWRGCLLTAWRLLRCQPLCEGGADPVPERFRFARCRCHEDSRHTR